MSIKSLAELGEKMAEKGLENADEMADKFLEEAGKLDDVADLAKKIITASVDEETLVHCIEVVSAMDVSASMMSGDPALAVFAIKNKELLSRYTHSIVLEIIGLLISDEVL